MFCPLLAISNPLAVQAGNHTYDCLKETCAWWTVEELTRGHCAILDIALSLDAINNCMPTRL